MSELDDLTTLVRASTPLLVIETVDEQRVIDCFRHVISQALHPLWRWTLTDGLSRLDFARGHEACHRMPPAPWKRSAPTTSAAST